MLPAAGDAPQDAGAADLGQRLRTDLAQRRHLDDLDRPVSPLGDQAGHLVLLRCQAVVGLCETISMITKSFCVIALKPLRDHGWTLAEDEVIMGGPLLRMR